MDIPKAHSSLFDHSTSPTLHHEHLGASRARPQKGGLHTHYGKAGSTACKVQMSLSVGARASSMQICGLWRSWPAGSSRGAELLENSQSFRKRSDVVVSISFSVAYVSIGQISSESSTL